MTRTTLPSFVVSTATVRNHIARIFQKLGVRTRPQAMVVAQQAGIRSA